MSTIPEVAEKIKKEGVKSLIDMFKTDIKPAPIITPVAVASPTPTSIEPVKKETKKIVSVKKPSKKVIKPIKKIEKERTSWTWITEPWKEDAKLLEKGAKIDFNYYLNQAETWMSAYPVILMSEREKTKKDLESVKEEIEKETKKLIEIKKNYAEKTIETLDKYNQQLTDIYSELMKHIPKMEPDEKTQWARNLAMALMAISGFVHPGYSPYFYMAIPQIVEYWRNEDRENFEMAMEKFNTALNIAGIKMNYLTQITENNLKKLQSLEGIDVFPVLSALENLGKEADALREQILNYENLYLDFLGKLPERFARLADIKGRTDIKLLSEQLDAWWKQMQAELQSQRNWIYYLSVITKGGERKGEKPLTPALKSRLLKDIDKKAGDMVDSIVKNYGGKTFTNYYDIVNRIAYEIIKEGENFFMIHPEAGDLYLDKVFRRLKEKIDLESPRGRKFFDDLKKALSSYIE